MDDKEWLRGKLDLLEEHVSDIKVTLAVNTASLVDHMARTKQLEDRVEPLEKHAAMFSGVLKAVAVAWGVLATGLGIFYTIMQILGKT